jgi:hypothetical protein
MPVMNAQDTNCVLYPIHLTLAYETDSRNRAGQGRTLALGGRIVRFSTDQNLRVGQEIRMELTWRAPLDDGTNLNLWMFGTVVRSAHVEVEVRITAYEFRFSAPAPMIRRSHPQPIRPHSPLMTLANIGASGSKARQEGESFCASRSLQSPPPLRVSGQPLINLHCQFGVSLVAQPRHRSTAGSIPAQRKMSLRHNLGMCLC